MPLPEALPQPRWLRQLHFTAVLAAAVVAVLQFCHMAFGFWRSAVWFNLLLLALTAFYAAGFSAVVLWQRKQRRER